MAFAFDTQIIRRNERLGGHCNLVTRILETNLMKFLFYLKGNLIQISPTRRPAFCGVKHGHNFAGLMDGMILLLFHSQKEVECMNLNLKLHHKT